MIFYRTILDISYLDHINNDQVRSKIQQHIGTQEDHLTTVKNRKLRWYGHVTRSDGLAKTVLRGTMIRFRGTGRQKKNCNDSIEEWMEKSLVGTQVLEHDHHRWMRPVDSSARRRPNNSFRGYGRKPSKNQDNIIKYILF